MKTIVCNLVGLACVLLLGSCGSKSSQNGPTLYPISGYVQGSSGPVALSNNQNDAVVVPATGSFSFSKKLPAGASYLVTVESPPVGQICGVTNPGGTVSGDVNNILVTCQSSSLSDVTSATAVLGQTSFSTNASDVSQTALHGPIGKVAVNGNMLYVADSSNNRIVVYSSLLPGNGSAAISVIGQADFNSGQTTLDANHFNSPTAISIAGNRMAVVDADNNRVLLYNTVPSASGLTPASVVLGQQSFTTAQNGCGSGGMFYPEDVTLTASGKLVVSDTINNRLLLWNSFPTKNGASPDVILGQADPNTCLENGAAGNTTASTLAEPVGVWTDGNMLITADFGNNRVLIWSSWPTTNGAAANIAVGQATMSGANTGTSASNFNQPVAVNFNGTSLTVTDSSNNRILSWAELPTTTGAKADAVLGQSSFYASDAGTSENAFSSPGGIFSYNNYFYVCDTGNNRVLVYVLGQ